MASQQDNEPIAERVVRRLSAQEKLSVAYGLRQTAWELAAAGVRLRHPGLPEKQVQEQVREIFLRAVTT